MQWSENIRSREIRISYQEEWFPKLQEAHVDLVLLPSLIIEVTALDLFRDFDSLLRRIDEHRRRIEAERAADLAWRQGKAIDGMRLRLNRWLK